MAMTETAEFRVVEKFASKLFADNEGTKLGIARKITIATDDPRFERIGEVNKEIRATTKGSFFYGWRIKRQYTHEELAEAKLLKLVVATAFEPAGEECGTKYDESTACPKCGSGATQISDLYLDLRKVPKRKEIATTIANEIIVSQHLAERMIDAGLTGFDLRPVRHKARYEDDPVDYRQVPTGREMIAKALAAGMPHGTGRFDVWQNRTENRSLAEQARAEHAAMIGEEDRRKNKPLPVWYQLIVTSADAQIVPPTRVGINPFDDDPKGECRCPQGDLIGLNLLSEVSIAAASRGEADIVCSRQYVGLFKRSRRVILISPRFWRFLETEKLKGVIIEVVHLV